MSSRTQHWQRWDVLDDDDDLVYYTQSWDPIDYEALATTLRVDGVVRSLWDAQVKVVSGRIDQCYYGYVDGDVVPTLCGPDGVTDSGEVVDEVIAGSFVYLSE